MNGALEPGTTAPQTPPKGPSDDLKYLSHAFEAIPPITLSAWNVERIRAARDDHALGVFGVSALLADAVMTDARISAAMDQRLGPLLGIPREVLGGPRWNGKGLTETVRVEAAAMFLPTSPTCAPGAMAAHFVSTAMMGVAILQNVALPRPDGSRVDFETRPWPMQLSFWNEALRRYQVYTTDGVVTVEPNDGKWIVIEPRGPRSFLFGAIRALGLGGFADRSYALRDRSNHSAAHGSIGVVGTLPPNIATESPEGKSFSTALQKLQRARAGLIKANGSSVDTFEPKSMAWQIFSQIVASTNDDILLRLTGLADKNIYKPITQIDGVKASIVRDELGASDYAYNQGLLRPWTLLNFGDEDLVPTMQSAIPDPREQERLDALGRQYQAFTQTIDALKASGLIVDQATIDVLSTRFRVDKFKLAPTPPPAPLPVDGPPPTPQQDAAQIARDGAAAS